MWEANERLSEKVTPRSLIVRVNLFNARDWFWKSGFGPISWTTDDHFFGFGEVDE